MGDWKSIDEFDDGKGVSLVLVNSIKAKNIFKLISNKFYFVESNINDALQTNLVHPSIPSKSKDKFWNSYIKKGYSYSVEKYTKAPIIKRIIKSVLIKIGIFNFIKKMRAVNG